MITELTAFENLRTMIARQTRIPPEELSGDESLDMLGVDSVGTISLAAHIEEQFNVIMGSEDITGDATINEICKVVFIKVQNAKNNHDT